MPDTFTPEQIAQILEEFFKVVGTRQYIGARYVPIFGRKDEESIEWDNTAPYEPLTIVLYQGNSYTSRQYVPVGVEITNQEFWALTGNYNAQVEQYRRVTAAVREVADNALSAANNAQTDIDTLLPKADFSAENTVKKYINDAHSAATAAQTDIDTLLPKSDFSAENTVKKYVDRNKTRVLSFDTVADMENASYLESGMVCHTNGFHASGDGGAAYYTISASSTANGMDVLALQGGLYATFIKTDNYVYPEQFGCTNELSILNDVIGLGYTHIKLYGKEYKLSDTINTSGVNGGYIEGSNLTNFLSSDIANVQFTRIVASGLKGKAAFSVNNCRNFSLRNFSFYATSDDDAPDVCIYLGRGVDYLSSNNNNIEGLNIYLPYDSDAAQAACNGHGNVAIYNNACEVLNIQDCSILSVNGIVQTDRDCFGIASSVTGGYNYVSATCTVVRHRNLSIESKVAFTLSYVTDMTFDNIDYENARNFAAPIVFRADFTNSPAHYWNSIKANVHCEQNLSNMVLIDFSDAEAGGQINSSDFECFIITTSNHNRMAFSKNANTLNRCTFKVYTNANASASSPVIDFTTFNGSINTCTFYSNEAVMLKNAIGCETYCYNTAAAANSLSQGSFGSTPYRNNVLLPFHINGIEFGTSWAMPSYTTNIKPGTIAICVNPDSNVAFWIFKNNVWKPVNISS